MSLSVFPKPAITNYRSYRQFQLAFISLLTLWVVCICGFLWMVSPDFSKILGDEDYLFRKDVPSWVMHLNTKSIIFTGAAIILFLSGLTEVPAFRRIVEKNLSVSASLALWSIMQLGMLIFVVLAVSIHYKELIYGWHQLMYYLKGYFKVK